MGIPRNFTEGPRIPPHSCGAPIEYILLILITCIFFILDFNINIEHQPEDQVEISEVLSNKIVTMAQKFLSKPSSICSLEIELKNYLESTVNYDVTVLDFWKKK
jgi:hypothetical protein